MDIGLVRAHHIEVRNTDPDRPHLTNPTDRETEAADDECVGEGRRRDVNIKTPLQVGSGSSVQVPVPLPVALEEKLSGSNIVDHGYLNVAGSPPFVEFDFEGGRPVLIAIDRDLMTLYPNRRPHIESNQPQTRIDIHSGPCVGRHCLHRNAGES